MKLFSEFLRENLLLEAEGSLVFVDSSIGKIEIIGTDHSDKRLDRQDQEISIVDQESIDLITHCLETILKDLKSGKIKNSDDGLKEAALLDRRGGKNLNVIVGLYINEPREPEKRKIRIGTTMTKKDFFVKGSHTMVYLVNKDGSISSMSQENWNKTLDKGKSHQNSGKSKGYHSSFKFF